MPERHQTLGDPPYLQVPPDWVKKYAPLLRCLRIDFSKMSAADRAAAEGSLASALQHASLTPKLEKTNKLRLGEFVSLHDRVNVELLKRLPVRAKNGHASTWGRGVGRHQLCCVAVCLQRFACSSDMSLSSAAWSLLAAAASGKCTCTPRTSLACILLLVSRLFLLPACLPARQTLSPLQVASLTCLMFTDAPDKRHKDALHRKRVAKHHPHHAPAAAAAAPAAAVAPAAPAAPVANGAAAAGGEPAAAAAPAAAAPAVVPGIPGAAQPAAPAGAAPEGVPQAASAQQKKRKGHRPPKVTGLQELAATCRQLAGLREIEVTTIDGYADFLLPQVNPLGNACLHCTAPTGAIV